MQKNKKKPTCTEQLGDVLREWNAQNKLKIKESSYNKYQYIINSNIVPYLGEYYIFELTTELLQNYINFLLTGDNTRNALSPKTVRDTISIIKQALRFASNLGIDIVCDLSALSVRLEKTELRILSQNEYQCLVSYLSVSQDLNDIGILLALFTGLRIGELCALTWDNINIQEMYITVKYTLQRIQDSSENAAAKTKIIISSPKSYCSTRIIPLPAFLTIYLKPYFKSDNSYFLTGRQDKFVEPRTLENHFKRTLNKLYIRNVTFHTLRHTFATRCVESQFDIKSLSEILGHSSVNITLNRYVHPSLEVKRKQMEKLEVLFTNK